VHRATPAALLLLSYFAACSAATNSSYQIEKDVHGLCRVWEFSGYNRAVEADVPYSPFVVRQVRGRIISDFWEGSWEPGVVPVLELRGPGASSKIYEVRGDKTGYLMLKNLPQGQYCFFASASEVGWNGAFGIIIIDRKASRKNEIEITLGFGVPSENSFQPVAPRAARSSSLFDPKCEHFVLQKPRRMLEWAYYFEEE
jgi:hypothetical protein